MIAGFAEREYTPAEGVVPGQIKKLYAKGQYTPLMAHVAILEADNGGAVFISLDLLFASNEFASKIRRKTSEITGIPYENIMFTCTHTHTGCGMDCNVWEYTAEPERMAVIEEKTIEAVKAANDSKIEIKLGMGIGYDQRYHFCRDFYTVEGFIEMNPGFKNRHRLVKPFAAIDHSVNVLRFDDMNGNAKCFIVNYANHLDTCPSKELFGADFPGYIRLELQKEYGEDVTVLFLNGCCANINHFDYMNGYDKTEHTKEGAFPPEVMGKGLADTIKNICPPLVTDEKDVNVQGTSRMHFTTRRRATAEQKEWAKSYLESVASGERASDIKRNVLAGLYLSDNESSPKTMDLEIQVIQIGTWAFVGLPGEIYSDIGLKIKANSPFANTVVVEIANGYNGYVAPDVALRASCYETTYSTVSYTGYGTDKVLIDGATNMLNALFDADNVKVFGKLKENVTK